MYQLNYTDLKEIKLEEKPIFLLNIALLPIRQVIQQIQKDNLRGNLPIEIWFMIVDEYIKSCKPHYKSVQPISISSSAGKQIIHCRGVELDMRPFEDDTGVIKAEKWLDFPECHRELYYHTVSDTATLYDIVFLESSTSALQTPKCLFSDLIVPDVIAFLQDGECWVCEERRVVCPGCPGAKGDYFGAITGCGASLACPLCLGLEFMAVDKAYHEEYYEIVPPTEEKAARDKRFRDRLMEFGYLSMVQISFATLKTLLFTLGPLAIPKLVGYYRAYKAKAKSRSVPIRPLPSHIYSALNILFVACVFALISTLPTFAPENIFLSTSSRLQTPNDVLFKRLAHIRPEGRLTELDDTLKPRIASLDARCLYLYYGPSILVHCPFCVSDEPLSYFWYALPMILLPHILHLFALGAATSSGIAGQEGNRWRTSAVMIGVGLAISECYLTGFGDWKANARATRAEDLNHFHWNMRIWRGLGIGAADAALSGFLWASSTNRMFVVPPTAAERMEASLRVLENARGRLGALGIVRNVVSRDDTLRRQGDAYWRQEGQIMSEAMDEREVVEGVKNALGSGRIIVTKLEEEARRFADGIIPAANAVQQRSQL
ncbi:MAG: hypothetical protein Q9203_006790 [Teloschistes exilis]